MQASRMRTWPRAVIFALLFLAAAVLWGVVMTQLELFRQTRARSGQVWENITVTYDGEPVITSSTMSPPWEEFPPRTLDGETAPTNEPLVRGVPFEREGERSYFRGPLNWEWERLAPLEGDRDLNALTVKLDVDWFLVRDASYEGRAYLVAYDQRSKLCTGYVGRRGFVRAEPPTEDQFVAGSFEDRTVEATLPIEGASLRERFFYLFDEDRLVEVNLRTHEMRTRATMPDVRSLKFVGMMDRKDVGSEAEERVGSEGASEFEFERRATPWLGAWSGNTLALIALTSDARVDFTLPPEIAERSRFTLHAVSPEQLVATYQPDPTEPWRFQLTWLAPVGASDAAPRREEAAELVGSKSSLQREANMIVSVLPIPALLTVLELVFGPLAAIDHLNATTYIEGLRFTMGAFWRITLVVVAISAALAWYVYRAESRQRRPRAGWIALAVFLLGIAGFVAYLAERRRAPMGACAKCGAETPRNRAACAACGAERAGPGMIGTEVFA